MKGNMTREFNKQQRDDERGSFRNNSSNRYGEERSSRPARVRLNREMVDRAWENGAPRLHADYRARNTNGQPPRNNWRSNQYSSQNTPGGNGAYGNRQHPNSNHSQNFERGSNGYQKSRPYSPGGPRSGGDGSRFDSGPRSGNDGSRFDSGPRSGGDGSRFDNRRGYNNGSSYQSGNTRFDNGHDRHDGPSYRSNTRPYSRPAQENERGRRGAARHVSPKQEFNRDRGNFRRNDANVPREPGPPHPRYLSRPEVYHAREARRNEEYGQQFEGDYEQFAFDDTPQPSRRPERFPRHEHRSHNGHEEAPQRHVTRLPDGRVLKGSRPAQRKNAQFWTEINQETDEIVPHPEQPPAPAESMQDQAPVESGEDVQPSATHSAPAKKVRKRTTSTTKGKKTVDPNAPKPSQKGYKWPSS